MNERKKNDKTKHAHVHHTFAIIVTAAAARFVFPDEMKKNKTNRKITLLTMVVYLLIAHCDAKHTKKNGKCLLLLKLCVCVSMNVFR